MSVKRSEVPEDFDEQLDTLEKKIERLRILYEQYFTGIEKLPPYALQRDVVRLFHQFSTYHIRKTTHKFRHQALVQRFNVHRAYWQRTVRAIEEGTYRRHRLKVQRRELARSGEAIDNAELAKRALLSQMKGEDAVEARRLRILQEDQEDDQEEMDIGPVPRPALLRGIERRMKRRRRRKKSDEEVRGLPIEELARRASALHRSTPLTSEGTSEPEPFPPLPPLSQMPAGAVGGHRIPVLEPPDAGPPSPQTPKPVESVLETAGISQTRARQIYEQFVLARQKSGQRVDHLSFERLAESMARQVSKTRQTLGVEQVDFDVVAKDDKIFLKPVPK